MTPLAIAGRMPLTNYLGQSAIHSLLFYGYGLERSTLASPSLAAS